MSSTKKVVVIGGSYAGFPLAQALEKTLDPSYQVILIDERDHFFHCIAALRAATIEDLDNKIYIPFTNTFKKNGKFVRATVTEIRSNSVVISPPHAEFGEVIEFEYLAIAAGSKYPQPAKIDAKTKEEGIKILQGHRKAVADAQDILILGGGPVGIELAGEIKTGYPKKNVTLVHSQNLPVNDGLRLKGRQAMKVGLEKLGVKLILGDSVIIPEGGLGDGRQRRILTTKRGVQIESDLQFVSFGVVPNSGIVSDLDPNLINPETRSIRVRPTLQLPGYDNIFALGDVADTDETKLAFRGQMHADVVAKNIVALTKKAPLKDYKKMAGEIMLVPLGKNGGVAVLPLGITGGNMISRTLKSSTLMVENTWKNRHGSLPNGEQTSSPYGTYLVVTGVIVAVGAVAFFFLGRASVEEHLTCPASPYCRGRERRRGAAQGPRAAESTHGRAHAQRRTAHTGLHKNLEDDRTDSVFGWAPIHISLIIDPITALLPVQGLWKWLMQTASYRLMRRIHPPLRYPIPTISGPFQIIHVPSVDSGTVVSLSSAPSPISAPPRSAVGGLYTGGNLDRHIFHIYPRFCRKHRYLQTFVMPAAHYFYPFANSGCFVSHCISTSGHSRPHRRFATALAAGGRHGVGWADGGARECSGLFHVSLSGRGGDGITVPRYPCNADLIMIGFLCRGYIDLVAIFGFLGNTQLKVLCIIASLVLLACDGATCYVVTERILVQDGSHGTSKRSWESPLKTLTLIFSHIRNLPPPIQRLCNIQFFAWIGWFPFLFYSTTWVAEIYTRTSLKFVDETPADAVGQATRAGSYAFLVYSIISLSASFLLPLVVAPSSTAIAPQPQRTITLFDRKFHVPSFTLPWLTLPRAWAVSHAIFCLAMLSTFFAASSVPLASAIIGLCGVSWAISMWAPFSLLGEFIARVEAAPSASREGFGTLSQGQVSRINLTAAAQGVGHDGGMYTLVETVLEGEYEMGVAGGTGVVIREVDEGIMEMTEHQRQERGRADTEVGGDDDEDRAARRHMIDKRGTVLELPEHDDVTESSLSPTSASTTSPADSAGILLGIHNMYIVLPQFLVTFFSSLVFRVLEPEPASAGAELGGEVEAGADAIGVVLRFGGVMAGVAGVLAWRLSRQV
ncbi:hypothetical protein BC937DRAFT_87687 [Endogone sp. FLAS-F59071]|nr:hypothetical protein BC937DRAFT_87687 [Endogone sp. FLAS-F59071]|eukprot:RUS22705.1 hypothetical protein BC937DRAFT_87687 [Endogone sp. FLAS-F59071]